MLPESKKTNIPLVLLEIARYFMGETIVPLTKVAKCFRTSQYLGLLEGMKYPKDNILVTTNTVQYFLSRGDVVTVNIKNYTFVVISEIPKLKLLEHLFNTSVNHPHDHRKLFEIVNLLQGFDLNKDIYNSLTKVAATLMGFTEQTPAYQVMN